MDFKIPKQLNGMKFCRVRYKTKKPFEKDWTNKPYTYEEISKYFPKENYGILTGIKGLGVLDDDTEDKILISLFEKTFEDTFKVREHEYIFLNGWDGQKIIFYNKIGKHCGELQGKGQQVVGVGSMHPSGEIYELKKDVEIKEIDFEIFKAVFQDYLPELNKPIIQAQEKTDWEGEDVKNIPITNVISLGGLKDMGEGSYQGSHPGHGSDGGMNFRVDTLNNTWYCFRCSAGGSSPELIAVMEGIIDCSQSGRGCLSGEKGSQVIQIAREKYGLKAPEIEKEPMGWALSINIKKLAERYNFINCLKCSLPFSFDEKLGFFKCLNCGDYGGLKVFANKIINNYNSNNCKEVIQVKMNIKEFAKSYEPQKMKLISDLDSVKSTIEFKTETRKDRENKDYLINFIMIDGVEYRVPISVVEQLKIVLESKPDLETFKVSKTGEGMATKYQVIPL